MVRNAGAGVKQSSDTVEELVPGHDFFLCKEESDLQHVKMTENKSVHVFCMEGFHVRFQ